jgi:hypothetical protein
MLLVLADTFIQFGLLLHQTEIEALQKMVGFAPYQRLNTNDAVKKEEIL